MADKIALTVGHLVHKKLYEISLNDGFEDVKDYLMNIISEKTSGMKEDPEVTTNLIMKTLKVREFDKETIGEMFVILASKMSPKERKLAEMLLKDFDSIKKTFEAEKSSGIYEVPKQNKSKPERKLDNMEVNNDSASDVIGEQLFEAKEEEQEALEDEDIEIEEEVEYEEPLIKMASKKEIKQIIPKTKVAPGDELSGTPGADPDLAEAPLNVKSVSHDDMDPDSDTPGWNDDEKELEEKALFIDDKESAMVISEQPGLSDPVKPKKAKVLSYDPKEGNNSQALIGQYADVKDRIKTTSVKESARHNANFLKSLGVSTSTINEMRG